MNELVHVVGEAKADEVAVIRLFGRITEESAKSFIDEFLWLENCVRPSKICVHINCEGGSVVYGMGVYSVIQSCSRETECMIEGIAASMGSVVWAAGNVSKMRDYSILMIHNPFVPEASKGKSTDVSDVVKAFSSQIETIYRKRWGLSQERVQGIMSGADGKDGTFFTAAAAVKAGILPKEHVVKSSKQRLSKVQDALKGLSSADEIRCVLCGLCEDAEDVDEAEEEIKPSGENKASSRRKGDVFPQIRGEIIKSMNEETVDFHYGAVVASLGFTQATDVTTVMNRISELVGAEGRLKDATGTINSLKIELAGETAKLQNTAKELEKVSAELNRMKSAQAELAKQKNLEIVKSAIEAGKIEGSTECTWLEMLEKNFELAQATLSAIPPREKISEAIAKDPQNVQNAIDAQKDAETLMHEKVEAVLGKDFEYKKLN